MSIKEEQEANAFALELLMPKHMILEYAAKYSKEQLSTKKFIDRMCKVFEVSEIAMISRLLNLGILTTI